MLSRVSYNVKKIETGYLVDYYFNGETIERAFTNWKDTLKFLQENPPKVYDLIDAHDTLMMEIE